MDEVTKSKVQIYSKRSQWEPALLELIEADQLPVRYGGKAPDFTPEECIQSLNRFVLPSSTSVPLSP